MITPRLRLAPVSSADLAELFDLHADPRAFAEDLTEPLTELAQMRWVLGQWIDSWRRHGTGYLTVRPRATGDGRRPLLGVVGLTPLTGEQALSAYWRLDPAATGHGLATEAMSAVLARPALGARHHEVLAVTAAENLPSRALAARLGFSPAPPDRPVPGDRPRDVLLIRPPDAPLSRRSTT
ncbi:GNAT family N-acetyltransferase [Brachybacterium sp. P6-10-X1]|uniref:GNAT family N-acetyltransferase n=1 Tax=Brachybacterium sp. P6-10-X1 TaxID=1903186 RepID=UPI00156092F3|nr:GNAT family N-acetyltransferase [Brachybacterium sp. P6-10-X1]